MLGIGKREEVNREWYKNHNAEFHWELGAADPAHWICPSSFSVPYFSCAEGEL